MRFVVIVESGKCVGRGLFKWVIVDVVVGVRRRFVCEMGGRGGV